MEISDKNSASTSDRCLRSSVVGAQPHTRLVAAHGDHWNQRVRLTLGGGDQGNSPSEQVIFLGKMTIKCRFVQGK